MTKDRASAKAKNAAPKAANANVLRTAIERTDRELAKLMNERAKASVQLAKLEPQAGAPPASLDEALDRAAAHNKGPLPDLAVRSVFRELVSATRALQETLRVAFLGPAYSYSHLATLNRFGHSIEPVPVGSIAAVFEEVNRGHARYGVVPLENSTDGRIADTLDMFARLRTRVCGEVQLPIHHSLLALCQRHEIEDVYSRPQALSQCRNWLAKHLPQARTVEVTSTATAAQLARDKRGAAAIAGVEAGRYYGLETLAENIEDNEANVTRFAVIGDETAPRTGRDKTAMFFQVEHRPGSLADAMLIFKRNRLNLTWIESFPVPKSEGAYLFFIEMDGHEADLRVRKALAALGKKAIRLEVLGSYPRAEAVG